MLPRRLDPTLSDAERGRWRIVRLDTHAEIAGEIVDADAEIGRATMRVRGQDDIKDGVRAPTYLQVAYDLGPGSIAIVRR